MDVPGNVSFNRYVMNEKSYMSRYQILGQISIENQEVTNHGVPEIIDFADFDARVSYKKKSKPT